jgi:hypothetical protein
MPIASAWARPAASGLFDNTSAISAGYEGAFAASIKATMLEPRPEMRTATRFLAMRSPSEIEVPAIGDPRGVVGDRDDLPD